MQRNAKYRLERMLDRDKEEMNEASRNAALSDFLRVGNEYFDAEPGAKLTIKRVKGVYEINFSFRAYRVKNFSTFH